MIEVVRGEPEPPALNVVMHVAGCRSEFQPFLALGQVLQRKHGHRVRIATHPGYRGEIENGRLEFSSIGTPTSRGSNSTLMTNKPTLTLPKRSSIASDESIERTEIYKMIQACCRSCYDTSEQESKIGLKMSYHTHLTLKRSTRLSSQMSLSRVSPTYTARRNCGYLCTSRLPRRQHPHERSRIL